MNLHEVASKMAARMLADREREPAMVLTVSVTDAITLHDILVGVDFSERDAYGMRRSPEAKACAERLIASFDAFVKEVRSKSGRW